MIVECNSYQKWNNDKCPSGCKRHHICKKNYIRNPSTCNCKIGAYLKSIDDDSTVACDGITDVTDTVPTDSDDRKWLRYRMNCYILTHGFISNYIDIHSCYYLLHKIG